MRLFSLLLIVLWVQPLTMQDAPTLADPREIITADNADQLTQLAAFEMPHGGSAVL